jgi:hypothetical protein
MNRTSLAVLALITALVVIAAIVSYSRRQPAPAAPESDRLYPELAERVNDVASITIQSGAEPFVIARHNGDWGLETKGGYPVTFEKVKQTILGLAALEIIEPKTSRPEYYDRLGVTEPGPDVDSTLVTLRDEDGGTLASLIIGDTAPGGGRAPRRFVRKADDAQAWLVEGQVSVDRTPLNWIDRELLRLPRTRVQSVTVAHPDGERIHLHRNQQSRRNFLVDDVPERFELQNEGIANSIAGAAGYLRIEDVAPAADVDFASGQVTTVEFRTFDGLLVTLEVLPVEDGAWLELCAAAEEDAALPEPDANAEAPPETAATQAEEINRRAAGWAFRINRSAAQSMTKRMADLIQEIEPEHDEAEETGDADGSDAH